MSNSEDKRPPSSDGKKLLSIIAIAALAVVFAIDWGPGSRGCDPTRSGVEIQQEAAATVNGKEIPLREFLREYAQQLEYYKSQGLPAEMAKQLGLHTRVLDGMVNLELLSQAAESRGLAASDDDLRDALTKDPSFQKDGKFSSERYKEVVRNYVGTTEVAYEAKLRRKLSAKHMEELVESAVVVSDEEVKARYLREGDRAKASFVRFNPAMYADKVPAPKPAEVDAWAAAHGKELQDYYDLNKISFFQAERVKARQILLRVDKDAPPEKKAEVKAKIENLRKELVDGKKDFAELAKQFSEDTLTKEKGGDLGLIERLQVPGAFADVLFALKPGEVTVPVETPLGFHLGMVEEKKAPEQKPLDMVKHDVALQLMTREKAKDLARADAEKALAEAKKGKKLAELFPPPEKKPDENNPLGAAPETRPEAKETGEIVAGTDVIPVLGQSPEAQKAIFARKEPGLIEDLVTVGDAFAVIVVDERKTPSDADFEAQKAQLRLEAIKGKQYEVREAFLKSLKQSGTVVTNDKAIDKVLGEG